nr:hypothetical protein [Tanacetum cinerariifolium]
MNQYTQYCGYLEQLEDTEEYEGESSEKRSRRYIARERELKEEKLRRDYFGDENTPPVYPKEYFCQREQHSTYLGRTTRRQRRRNKELRIRRVHEDVRQDIVEHLWNLNNEI